MLSVIQDRRVQQMLRQENAQTAHRAGGMSLGLWLEQSFWKGGRGRGNRLIDQRPTMRPLPSPAFRGHMRIQRRGESALQSNPFVPSQAARIIVAFCQLGKLPRVRKRLRQSRIAWWYIAPASVAIWLVTLFPCIYQI